MPLVGSLLPRQEPAKQGLATAIGAHDASGPGTESVVQVIEQNAPVGQVERHLIKLK